MTAITRIETALNGGQIDDLIELLIDCVEGGASVGFRAPLSHDEARTYWQNVSAAIEAGEKALFITTVNGGIIGSVQIILAMPPNQPHRGEISKMLVHSRIRRLGLGSLLLEAAESQAKALGKTLLVLDTQTGSAAEQLYAKAGWTALPPIPDYAHLPQGGLAPTTVFWKRL